MTAGQQAQTAPHGAESYFRQSRRPLASLVFVLPLVLAYEIGTWALHLDAAAGYETRILAFSWIRQSFARLGATGPMLAPAAVIGLLLGWHFFARHPWRLRPTVPLAMVSESLLLALPLLLLAGIITGTHLLQQAPDTSVGLGLIVLGIGAGVYEELLFRLIGFMIMHAVLVDLLGLRAGPALVITLLVTSVAFSGYHYVGSEQFEWLSFFFRTLAGVWLGLVFAARGFGLAAGAHAAYDVLLILAILWLPGLNATL